jgi:hypothetical protein
VVSQSAHSSLVRCSLTDRVPRGEEKGDAVGERRTFLIVLFSESVEVPEGVLLPLPQTDACDSG